MADITASRILIQVNTNADQATVSLNKLDNTLDKTGKNVTDLDSKNQKLGKSFLTVKKAAIGFIAALGVRELARASDTYTSITNKLKLVTDSTEDLKNTQEDLFRISQRSRSSFEATVGLYARLARSTKGLGVSGKELQKVTDSINKTFIISGASAEEASNAIRQLSQGLAAGALRGDEFNSVAEQAPRLQEAIAESLGVTVGELRDLAAQGKITSEVIITALREQGAAIEDEFGKLTPTIGQALQVLENSFIRLIGLGNEQTQASKAIASALIALADIVNFVADNFDKLAFFIKAAAASFITLKIGAVIGGFQGVATALGGVIAAFKTLKIVIAANPFGAIALAVAGLLTLLAKTNDEVAEFNKLSKEQQAIARENKLKNLTNDLTSLNTVLKKTNQNFNFYARDAETAFSVFEGIGTVTKQQKEELIRLGNSYIAAAKKAGEYYNAQNVGVQSTLRTIANFENLRLTTEKTTGSISRGAGRVKKSFAEIKAAGLEALAAAGDFSAILEVQRKSFAEQKKIVAKAGLDTNGLLKFQQQQRLTLFQETFQKILEQEQLSFEERQALLEEQKEILFEGDRLTNDERLAAQKAYNDQSIALERQRLRAFAQSVNFLGGIASDTVSILQNVAQVQTNLDAQEIERLKARGASQEEIAKKEKKLARKRAKDLKKFGRFTIIISTAEAVARALASPAGPPTSFVLAALAGAKGATQLAVNESTPIPAAQFGGTFTVPPGNQADSGLVRVNQGENVTVEPVRSSGETGGGMGQKRVIVQIGDRDFDGFLVESLNKNLNNGKVQIRRSGVVRTA